MNTGAPDHKAYPIPPVEVYARPLGMFAWTCPDCDQDHKSNHVPWRRAQIQCRNCKHNFRLGLGFSATPMPALFMGRWNGSTGNRLNPIGSPIKAALKGRIEWLCPICQCPQMGESCTLICTRCESGYFVNLLLYISKKFKLTCPFDWLVVRNAKTYYQESLPAPAFGQGSGTSS